MSEKKDNKGSGTGIESREMKSIVLEHRVFWGTLSIELPDEEGHRVKVGMSVALVGTDPDTHSPGDSEGRSSTFERLMKLAGWLTSEAETGVRFDVRSSQVFHVGHEAFVQPQTERNKVLSFSNLLRL